MNNPECLGNMFLLNYLIILTTACFKQYYIVMYNIVYCSAFLYENILLKTFYCFPSLQITIT